MKPFWLIVLMVIGACTSPEIENEVQCTLEAKICPDGTAVGRIPPNCSFSECPVINAPANITNSSNDLSLSACGLPDAFYTSMNTSQCMVMKFRCIQGTEPFFDACGCGCKPVAEFRVCSDAEHDAEICTAIFKPVCGWFDPEKVQCITYPCALTFSNACHSCSDDDVLYWTDGECPKP